MELQMKVYVAHLGKRGIDVNGSWLDAFAKFTNRQDVLEVTDADVTEFCANVGENRTSYAMIQAEREVSNLRRYYSARGRNVRKKKKGRPLELEKIMLVKNLSRGGLSVRKIAQGLGSYPTQVQRWNKYPVEKLSKFSPI